MSTTWGDLALLDDMFNENSNWQKPRNMEKTLGEDFQYWWRLPKYKKQKIDARDNYSDIEIKERHGSMVGWPNPAIIVSYWVELENGLAVGYSEIQKGKCTFPIVRMKISEDSKRKEV